MVERFSCALLLLAAGASRRMGRPKQLLPVGKVPLLRHVIEASGGFGAVSTVVVLGAHAEEIKPSLAGLPIHLVVNEGWEEGMGSSIRVGVDAILKLTPGLRGIVVALGDQPDFSTGHLQRLLAVNRETGRSIVASRQRGQLMPPAFFSAVHFPMLASLRGDTGARMLLRAETAEVAAVDIEELGDLDAPADYEAYLGRFK